MPSRREALTIVAEEETQPQSRLRDPAPDFTWAGMYERLSGELHVLEAAPGVHRSMSLVLLRANRERGIFFKDLAQQASRLLLTNAVDRQPGHVVLPGALHQRLLLHAEGPMRFPVLLPNAGRYVLFTQHHPAEFAIQITGVRLLSQRSLVRTPGILSKN